jgi:hypothetical protein
LSVAFSGNSVVAGAPFEPVGANENQGAAHVFGVSPAIAIAAPADGATFTQGQVVAGSYSCSAA